MKEWKDVYSGFQQTAVSYEIWWYMMILIRLMSDVRKPHGNKNGAHTTVWYSTYMREEYDTKLINTIVVHAKETTANRRKWKE